jgi:transposase
MTSLVDKLVPDDLWALVELLLPPPPRPPYGGRHRTIGDRNCLAALVFMARTPATCRFSDLCRTRRPGLWQRCSLQAAHAMDPTK